LVTWPTAEQQEMYNVAADQILELKQSDAHLPRSSNRLAKTSSRAMFASIRTAISQPYATQQVNDFKRQSLLFDQPSYFGPCLVKGDLNGDGQEDVYAGGHGNVKPQVYLQVRPGQFEPKAQPAFKALSYEDADAAIFDANGDGKNDLYVAQGGYGSLEQNDPQLQDRLYLNNGTGTLVESMTLPKTLASKGCVVTGDLNGDSFPDLFVGGRIVPGRYPETPLSFLLLNDGKGNFTDVTDTFAPELRKFGMITTAAIRDLNGDGHNELVVAGEWLPISVFEFANQNLRNATGKYFDSVTKGWWNKVVVADLNNDSIPDIVAGNMGTNNQLHATADKPVEMYAGDFDKNGSIDPLLTYYIQNKSFPFVTRDELLEQLAPMRKRFTTYNAFADATLDNILSAEDKRNAQYLVATEMKTLLFLGTRHGKFTKVSLPAQAQFSPVYAIAIGDYNRDTHADLLLAGNDVHTKIRIGNSDANYGQVFLGDGRGNFRYIDQTISGLNIKGEVRSVLRLNDLILVGIGGQNIQSFKLVRQ
jgi:hypothetical protein